MSGSETITVELSLEQVLDRQFPPPRPKVTDLTDYFAEVLPTLNNRIEQDRLLRAVACKLVELSKFANDPDAFVEYAIEPLARAYANHVTPWPDTGKV